ncbi:MAG: hypothetical protein AABY51_08785 [Deltaproteobacteria bacterium]
MQFGIISQKKTVYKKGRARRCNRQGRGDKEEIDGGISLAAGA